MGVGRGEKRGLDVLEKTLRFYIQDIESLVELGIAWALSVLLCLVSVLGDART